MPIITIDKVPSILHKMMEVEGVLLKQIEIMEREEWVSK